MFAQLHTLAKTNLWVFWVTVKKNLREGKLLLFTLTIFLIGYQVAGYAGLFRGLRYLYDLPGVGLLLTERVLYMLYFFFFCMLVFSNAILLYSGLFRGKETGWLITLPLDQRAIFCWKVLESLVVSSWGVVILGAPMVLAFGKVFEAPASFYVKAFLMCIPYLVLPATVAAALVVLMVRCWGRAGKLLLWGVVGWVVYRAIGSWRFAHDLAVNYNPGTTSTSMAIKEVLGHTDIAVHPLMPSTWMSEMMLHWMRGYESRGTFYSLLLTGYTLMGIWLCADVLSRMTYRCWNISHQNRAAKSWRKSSRGAPPPSQDVGETLRKGFGCSVWRWSGAGRINAALLQKDAREFVRDPSQWIPCSVLFGLLFLYSYNLRNFAADPNDSFWVVLISAMSFGVSSLAVSTLSTRFIYPLFSLEGRRLWIVGLAPFPPTRIFWIKFILFSGGIAVLTSLLMLIGGVQLRLPWETIFRFMAGICLVSIGLTSLSLGLGVLFPNYHESNPSKIVSGFGGTLSLILNFLFVLAFLALFLTPAFLKVRPLESGFENNLTRLDFFCNAGLVVVAGVTTIIPLFLSLRRIKRLELLGKL